MKRKYLYKGSVAMLNDPNLIRYAIKINKIKNKLRKIIISRNVFDSPEQTAYELAVSLYANYEEDKKKDGLTLLEIETLNKFWIKPFDSQSDDRACQCGEENPDEDHDCELKLYYSIKNEKRQTKVKIK